MQISASPTVLRRGESLPRKKKLLFPTSSFPNPSPPFIHHCLPSPPTVCQLFILPKKITPSPPTVFYWGLSLKADIIYRRSSCRLISQHKSLSPVHPSLTLHPSLPSPLPPTSFSATHPLFYILLFIPPNRKETKWYHGWFNMSGGSRRVNLCARVREGTSSLDFTMLHKRASVSYLCFQHFKFLAKQINSEGRHLLPLWSFRGRC